MEQADRLSGYLGLLNTRQKINRRNLILDGIVFLLVLLATTAMLLFTAWNARMLWLMGLFDLLFGLNFILAWVRHEVNREKIELVNNL
ncbi:hypothetical protein LARV_00188 [Longilinea arvoryzae]|uniref:Uncharacterized protein n=1 Tax=Longilinea arvoryzae TaxID=360412 RepID=A0A0S7BFM6_9CHLR|nr:hypothetical protein [Longilinea arvoryzae]GAP12453.1 hypothetical protein LARV_00188 [Longilinea arvoryzae]